MTEQQEIDQILERNRDLIEALKNLTSRITGEADKLCQAEICTCQSKSEPVLEEGNEKSISPSTVKGE